MHSLHYWHGSAATALQTHWLCPSVLAWAGKGWHRPAHLKTLRSWFFSHFLKNWFCSFCPGPQVFPLDSILLPLTTHPHLHSQTDHSNSPGSAANNKHSFWQYEEKSCLFTLEILHMLFCLGHCLAFVHKCLMTFLKKNKRKSLCKKAFIIVDLCLRDLY